MKSKDEMLDEIRKWDSARIGSHPMPPVIISTFRLFGVLRVIRLISSQVFIRITKRESIVNLAINKPLLPS